MEARPENFGEEDLSTGLAEHFGVVVHTASYAPVGFGDYHWRVTAEDGRQWFAKVSDLAPKEHCGPTPETALVGLRKAVETAATLHERAGLAFVVEVGRASCREREYGSEYGDLETNDSSK